MKRIGFVGLRRMGSNMVLNALGKGVEVVAFNRTGEITAEFVKEASSKNLFPAYSLPELCSSLPSPRIVWIMVTAGKPVDDIIEGLLPHLKKGDLIIDGGNSFYKDSMRRHKQLAAKGVDFLDCGTSGGLEGARTGACLTIGGEKKVFERAEWLFKSLACPGGYLYCGPAGAGHFVKVTHNGIEYAMLQAYGEGFEMLARGPYQKLDLAAISRVWSHGSVIRSWMTKLAERAFSKDARLEKIGGAVGGGETGRWTLETAKEHRMEMPALMTALEMRERSSTKEVFAGKVIAALRNEFGGHETAKVKK